jgi:hypothetical protein
MEKDLNQSEQQLSDITNYRHTIDNNFKNIINVYYSLIERYFNKFSELNERKDTVYVKYVVRKGVEIINHVFTQCLIYTKNLELTFQTTQSAFLYYCEFMSQIGIESHSYLKLNVKDATLFVYKKTIFEINQNMRKNMTTLSQDVELIDNFNIFLSLYNGLCFNLIDEYEFNDNKSIFEMCIHIRDILSIINKRILCLFDENNENKFTDYEITICLQLCETLRIQLKIFGHNYIIILPYIEAFLRKFKKSSNIKKIILKHYKEIEEKIKSYNFNEIINSNNVASGILYLFKV